VLQLNERADIKLHVSPELAAIPRKISNDYSARCAIAPVDDDIEVGLAAKLPSCSQVDVSHRSSLRNEPLGASGDPLAGCEHASGLRTPELGDEGRTGSKLILAERRLSPPSGKILIIDLGIEPRVGDGPHRGDNAGRSLLTERTLLRADRVAALMSGMGGERTLAGHNCAGGL